MLFLLAATSSAQELQVRIEPPSWQTAPGVQFRTVGYASGGTAPYTYEWFIGQERSGTINQVKLWTINAAGVFPVRVVAVDSAGRRGEATCMVTVGNPGGGPQPQPPGSPPTLRPEDIEEDFDF